MKKLLLLLFIICSAKSFSQAPTWIWERGAEGAKNDYTNAITTDKDGNVLITGSFSGNFIVFGSDTLFNSYAGGGYSDIFIVKYNANGSVLWAKSGWGKHYNSYWFYNDEGNGIITDSLGNFYITGNCEGDYLYFDDIFSLIIDARSLFILKCNPDGKSQWLRELNSSSGNAYSNCISLDSKANVYITGRQTGIFLTDTANRFLVVNTYENATNTNNIIVTKHDSANHFVWARDAGGVKYDEGHGISCDKKENLYVTGNFKSDTAWFDGTFIANSGPLGVSDIFLAKYDTAGAIQWVRGVGGNSDDVGYSVVADNYGHAYIAGYFMSPSIVFGNDTLYNSSNEDVFIAKYDGFGNVLWSKSAGNIGSDVATNITADPAGNIYVTGYFDDTVIFGNDTLQSLGLGDIFIVKYDSTGNELWAKRAGSSGTDMGSCVSTYGNDILYVTGSFDSPSVAFNSTLTNTGLSDVFVAKLFLATGIEETLSEDNSFLAFPNPSSDGVVYLKANKKIKSVEAYNFLGQTISLEMTTLNDGLYKLQLNTKASGTYFLRILTNEGECTKKILNTY